MKITKLSLVNISKFCERKLSLLRSGLLGEHRLNSTVKRIALENDMVTNFHLHEFNTLIKLTLVTQNSIFAKHFMIQARFSSIPCLVDERERILNSYFNYSIRIQKVRDNIFCKQLGSERSCTVLDSLQLQRRSTPSLAQTYTRTRRWITRYVNTTTDARTAVRTETGSPPSSIVVTNGFTHTETIIFLGEF